MRFSIDPIRFASPIAGLFKAWASSMRFDTPKALNDILALNSQGQPFVIVLWHDELFSITAFGVTHTTGLIAVVSASKDGQMVATVMEKLGQTTVRGSSSKGGFRALLKAKRAMDRENRMTVFAVDGPRGPRHEPKNGAIFLAQHARARIVPIRAYPKKKKIFEKAWDRFQLPCPFTRCQLVVGEPYEVTNEKLDKDVLARERERMKEILNSLKPE